MSQAGISARRLPRLAITAALCIVMASISACDQKSATSGTIIVGQQRILAAAAPTAIAAIASGGFAMAGKGGGAWAGITDSTGSLLWEFRDREPGIKPGQESSFEGVVQQRTAIFSSVAARLRRGPEEMASSQSSARAEE
jgi:hypothetical protein